MHFSLLTTLLLVASATCSPTGPKYRAPKGPSNAPVKGRWFDRIVVINLENTDYGDAENQHYLKMLARQGVKLTNYHAVTHPSQPNYVTQVYGDSYNIKDDAITNIPGKSLVDLLEAKGVSWKSYQEQYPGQCFVEKYSSDHLYVRKHNPFMSMVSVNSNPKLCAKVVDEKQLDKDIASNTVPQLVYYTPNMNNDGHDTGLDYATDWLQKFLEPRRNNPKFTKNTLIFITFDEQEDYDGDNHVYAVMLGPVVESWRGRKDSQRYSHYSLLRTIEDNWNLGSLGRNDKSAVTFKFPSRK